VGTRVIANVGEREERIRGIAIKSPVSVVDATLATCRLNESFDSGESTLTIVRRDLDAPSSFVLGKRQSSSAASAHFHP